MTFSPRCCAAVAVSRRHGAIAGLLSVVISLTGGCGNGDTTSREQLDAATAEFSAGRYQASVIELKNLLQDDPANGAARLLLGTVYLDLEAGAEAQKELDKAGEAGVAADRLAVGRARAALLLGSHEDALRLLEDSPQAASADWLATRGHAYLALDRALEARADFDAALAIDKNHVQALGGIADLLRQAGDLTGARATAERAAISGNSLPAWRLKADIDMAVGDFASAQTAFGRALELFEFDWRARTGLVRALMSASRYDDADRQIDRLAKQRPKHPVIDYFRAISARQRGDIASARNSLQRILSVIPGHAESLLMLASLEYSEGQFEQAVEYLTKFIEQRPEDVRGRKLLAGAYLQLREPAKAAKALQPVLDGRADDAELLRMLGGAYTSAGDYDAAKKHLERALRADPDGTGARTQLGIALLAAGDEARAIAELRTASDLASDFAEADSLIVVTLMRQGALDRALEAANSIAGRYPGSAPAQVLLGSVYLSKGDKESARRSFAKALAIEPGNAAAAVNLGRLALQGGDIDAAATELRRSLEKSGDNATTLMMLARMENDAGRSAEALKLLERAREADSKAFEPRVALAMNYVRLGRIADAVKVATEANQLRPDDRVGLLTLAQTRLLAGDTTAANDAAVKLTRLHGDWSEGWYQFGRGRQSAGDMAGAAEAFRKALSIDAGHIDARVALANALSAAGDNAGALDEARTAQRSDPDSVVVDELLARLYLRQNNVEEATRAAQRYVTRAPADPSGLNLLGGIAEITGDREEARDLYERARTLGAGGNDVAALLNLSRMARVDGDTSSARKLLATALAAHPANPETVLALAQIDALESGWPAAAKRLADAVKAVPNAAELDVALAEAELMAGRPTDALATARKAVGLRPEAPVALLMLARVLRETGQLDDALATARRVVGIAPKELAPHLELARVLLAKADVGGARQSIATALDLAPADPEARLMLARIALADRNWSEARTIAVDVAKQSGDGVAARLVVADATAGEGRLQAADELYRDLLRTAPSTEVMLRSASIRGRLGSITDTAAVIRSWLDEHPDDALARVAMGDTVLLQGDESAALREYELAVQQLPQSAALLNKLAWLYGRAGDERALTTAEQAYKLAPADARVADTYGWLLVSSDRAEKAVSVLASAVQQSAGLASDADRATVRYHLAVAYAKTGRLDEARNLLAQVLKESVDFPERADARGLLDRL